MELLDDFDFDQEGDNSIHRRLHTDRSAPDIPASVTQVIAEVTDRYYKRHVTFLTLFVTLACILVVVI